MVIIDSEEFKSPHGPRPVPQPLAPPPYAPLSPRNSSLSAPLPPPRSPGVRPTSPFSAPASNFLTIKRERADITGSWNINTALPPPLLNLGRSFSTGSDRESDTDAASETGTGTDNSDPATQGSSAASPTTSASVAGSVARPNLKLFSPRGKIDAAIRVEGAPRAWIEAVSRDEDVAVTFPPNSSGAPRAPIKLLARSTSGHVQVHLPHSFMGTLRVPSDTVLPPSLRSQSVVLSPSEPPIDRPPILDDSPTKAKLGLSPIPSRSVTPTPPSPPLASQIAGESAELQSTVAPSTTTSSSPPTQATPQQESTPRVEAPLTEASTTVTRTESDVILSAEATPRTDPTTPPAPQSSNVPVMEGSTISTRPPVETPAQETSNPFQPSIETPVTPSESTFPLARSTSTPTLSVTPAAVSTSTHNRSSSVSTHPIPAPPLHDASESSTVYFIGDLLRSGYDTNAPDKWTGDDFVIDSEFGRVRVCMYGEKAEVTWTEDVTSKVKDAIDWNKWKNATGSSKGLKEMLTMPKISVGGISRRWKFGK